MYMCVCLCVCVCVYIYNIYYGSITLYYIILLNCIIVDYFIFYIIVIYLVLF